VKQPLKVWPIRRDLGEEHPREAAVRRRTSENNAPGLFARCAALEKKGKRGCPREVASKPTVHGKAKEKEGGKRLRSREGREAHASKARPPAIRGMRTKRASRRTREKKEIQRICNMKSDCEVWPREGGEKKKHCLGPQARERKGGDLPFRYRNSIRTRERWVSINRKRPARGKGKRGKQQSRARVATTRSSPSTWSEQKGAEKKRSSAATKRRENSGQEN